GSKKRPPMLNKENYVPWSSRLLRYAKSRPNEKFIHNSIINGPYVRRMIPEPGDPNCEVPIHETFHVQTDNELTKKELNREECQVVQRMGKVDELKPERLGKTQDPLVLMATSNNPYKFPVLNQDQPIFNQNYMQQPMPNPEDITDPTTAMNMALALMAKAFKLNYSTPTNNNQRISLNSRNRQISQPGMNMGQDRQMQMVGGNGENQFRQYARKNVGNLNRYSDVQNVRNLVIQNAVQNLRVHNFGNQNGLIGVPGNANQNLTGNGNLVAARADGNETGHNGNQISDEIEEVNANCILMANLQQASTSGTQTDKALADDSNGSVEVHNYENFYDNEIFNMFTQEEQYTELLEPIPEPLQELESEIERLLKAVVSQDTMSVVQNNSVVDTLNLQTELERFENCIIKKENEYAKLWNDWEEKHVPNNVRASVRTKPITVSQPPVFTKKDVNYDSNDLSSTGIDNTKTRRPHPRSNTKNNRAPSASKSIYNKNKGVEVEDHHRNLLLSKNKKHMSSKCNNVKLATQNVKSKVVCVMCKQCLISVNHDVIQICLWCVDSGCSKHMTRNLKLLINFVWKFLGTVQFENDHGAAILGFSDLQWGNILITRVYFIEGLGHNLFSVGQFCDSDLEVAFRRNACFIKNLEGVDLLSRNRTTNLYTINLHDMASASPIFLMARTSSTKLWLWHQRLFVIPRMIVKILGSLVQKVILAFSLDILLIPVLSSSKPRLQSMTSGQISSGLNLTYAPSTITNQQPTKDELDLLFKAMYDDYIGGQPSAAQRTISAVQAQQVLADNVPNAMFDANSFVNPFATTSASAAESSSSQYVDPLNMYTFYKPYPYEFQSTKDHPLEQVIGEPSRPVLIRNELRSDGDMCIYALAVSTMEPKNVKEAITDPAWIKSMQEELLQFKRIDEWVLVPAQITSHLLRFVDADHPSHVYKLKKDLYGLKQASRAWYDKLSMFLLQNHFFKGTIDPTLFIRRFDNDILVVQVYVDGVIFGSTHPRPDIVHATCLCARYQAKLTEKHLKEVKRIFRYLWGTVNTGLWYTTDFGFELTGFSDADYAGCKDTFKSTSGGAQFLGEKLLTDYGFHFKKIPIYCDSKLAIAISCNPVQHSRTKHITVRYHFIKDHVEKGTIELYFFKTDYQLADIFTKALLADRFNYLVRRLVMRSLSPQEPDRLAKSQ
nr:putative reverse transcriptase, RNA-dependent DNA polymerase [Tanacetum cinerariifolium]